MGNVWSLHNPVWVPQTKPNLRDKVDAASRRGTRPFVRRAASTRDGTGGDSQHYRCLSGWWGMKIFEFGEKEYLNSAKKVFPEGLS